MRLRNIAEIKWPPDWGRAYAKGEKFEIGEEGGTLLDFVLQKDHIDIAADFSGKKPRGVIRHKDVEVLKRIAKALESNRGRPLCDIGDLEIPDDKKPPKSKT